MAIETTPAFEGLRCPDCGERPDDDASGRCPACGSVLDTVYDHERVAGLRETLSDRPFDSQWRYRELLPFAPADAVTADEGATPLVDCPDLAADLGVATLRCKDEGRNPTGSIADRGLSVAVTAALADGVDEVGLPSTGDGGQSAAAYAGRADLAARVFLPSRAGFVRKAMVNVHGGDMRVVEGRYDEAAAACREARADDEWHSLAPFETPYRHEGAKTALYEIVERLDWTAPDAVVVPAGHGLSLAGFRKAAAELRALGLVEETPALHAVQAEGCAPIVDAVATGADAPDPWANPDTICGGVEVADPAGGARAVAAVRESGGEAVAVSDEDALESAAVVNEREGVEAGVSGGVAAAGAWALAEAGAFDADDVVVFCNPAAGSKDGDVLRSHLMRQGI